MTIARFDAAIHYNMICEWWVGHGWPPVGLDHLPTGFVVSNSEQVPVCAGFVYFSGTAMCFFEWIVADPGSGGKERSAALDVLISAVKIYCQQAGAKTIFMSMKHDGLIAKLEKHGFCPTDKGMTNLVGRV